jgi:hypothetical protein
MTKDKLNLKLIFGKEKVQHEGSFISHLNMYFETPEDFVWIFFMCRNGTGASQKLHSHFYQ